MGERSAPFGDCLRGHREAAGLTQVQLAEWAELSAHASGALERGAAAPLPAHRAGANSSARGSPLRRRQIAATSTLRL
jgi:hypothetical protein